MGQDVFFIGDVAMDEYYSAPHFPRAKEKILVQTLAPQMGGMIANAASVFASYDKGAAFLAALNPGPLSQKLCQALNAAGLDTRHMVWDDTLPDSKTIVILAENEHTVFIPTMNLQSFALDDDAFAALRASKYLYSTFCELRPMRHKEMDAARILRAFKDAGGELWCDLDVADIRDADMPFFAFVDVLFLNETGLDNLRARLGGDVPQALFAMGTGMIVVTRAEKGCAVHQPNLPVLSVEGIAVPVVDVTGAGDTFCASFLFARTRTSDLRVCAEFANYAAARAVTGMGPRFGAAGMDAVLRFIAAQGGDTSRFAKLQE